MAQELCYYLSNEFNFAGVGTARASLRMQALNKHSKMGDDGRQNVDIATLPTISRLSSLDEKHHQDVLDVNRTHPTAAIDGTNILPSSNFEANKRNEDMDQQHVHQQ